MAASRALVAPEPRPGLRFGTAVGFAGSTLLIGTPGDETPSFPGRGLVHKLEVVEAAQLYCACTSDPPCWNATPRGGCMNGEGRGAELTVCGSASVGADELTLSAELLPPGQNGLFFMGAGATQLPFGNGQLCVTAGAAGLFRFPVRNSGAAGRIVEGPGLALYSQTNFGAAGQILGGQSWNFQLWYRDPAGPCSGFFNFSDAARIHFTP